MVGKTSFGFLSVKFMLIATLKAEKMYLPAASNLLVPAERSGCDIRGEVGPGDIWLWVGKTDREKPSVQIGG